MRNLEREIGTMCRKVAREIAEHGEAARRRSAGERGPRAAGQPRFHAEVRRRTAEPGVATGLAWTPVGGDVLFIEATATPGSGKLTHRPARRRDARVPQLALTYQAAITSSSPRSSPTTGSATVSRRETRPALAEKRTVRRKKKKKTRFKQS